MNFYTAVEAEESLVALWKCDDLSGGALTDSIGTYDGALRGSAAFSTSSLLPTGEGSCLDLDGVDDYVTCNDVLGFEYNEPFSLMAVVKLDTQPTAWRTLISKGNGVTSENRGYRVAINTTGKLVFTLRNAQGGSPTYYAEVVAAAAHNWVGKHLVVVTSDGTGTAGGLHLYVDGALCLGTTSTDTLGGRTIANTGAFKIGASEWQGDADTDFFQGLIQAVGVFDAELSAATVRALAANWQSAMVSTMLSIPSIEACWPLSDLSGTIATDLLGRYPGTHVNTPSLGRPSLTVDDLGAATLYTRASSEYTTMGNVLSKEYTSTFSIVLLCQLTTAIPPTGRYYVLVNKRDYAVEYGRGWSAFIAPNGCLYVNLVNDTSPDLRDEISTDVFDWSYPRCVAITFSYSSGSHVPQDVLVYIDGVLRSTSVSSGTLGTGTIVSTKALEFGAYTGPSTVYYVDGTLQNVAMFDAVLTQEQVTAIYDSFNSISETLSDSLQVTEALSVWQTYIATLSAGLVLADTHTAAVNHVLSELVRLSESAAGLGSRRAAVLDALRLVDRLTRFVLVAAADAAAFSDAYALHLAARLVDEATLSDQGLRRLSQTLAASVVLTDQLIRRLRELVDEQLVASDTPRPKLSLTLVESVDLSELLANLRRAAQALGDEVALADDGQGLRIRRGALAEAVVLGGVLQLPDGEYNAWVLNTQSLGLSRYLGYNFTSIAEDLATRSDGIYLLEGDDDAGTPIEAYLTTGLSDHGSPQKKVFPQVYLGVTTAGTMLLKVRTTDSVAGLVENWYELREDSADSDTVRFKPGKGLKARYWQWQLCNVGGADFDLNSMHLFEVILSRRI